MREVGPILGDGVCVCVCVCVCVDVGEMVVVVVGGEFLRGGPRLSSAKFTPAVVMSVGSVSNIPAQKLRPGLCV